MMKIGQKVKAFFSKLRSKVSQLQMEIVDNAIELLELWQGAEILGEQDTQRLAQVISKLRELTSRTQDISHIIELKTILGALQKLQELFKANEQSWRIISATTRQTDLWNLILHILDRISSHQFYPWVKLQLDTSFNGELKNIHNFRESLNESREIGTTYSISQFKDALKEHFDNFNKDDPEKPIVETALQEIVNLQRACGIYIRERSNMASSGAAGGWSSQEEALKKEAARQVPDLVGGIKRLSSLHVKLFKKLEQFLSGEKFDITLTIKPDKVESIIELDELARDDEKQASDEATTDKTRESDVASSEQGQLSVAEDEKAPSLPPDTSAATKVETESALAQTTSESDTSIDEICSALWDALKEIKSQYPISSSFAPLLDEKYKELRGRIKDVRNMVGAWNSLKDFINFCFGICSNEEQLYEIFHKFCEQAQLEMNPLTKFNICPPNITQYNKGDTKDSALESAIIASAEENIKNHTHEISSDSIVKIVRPRLNFRTDDLSKYRQDDVVITKRGLEVLTGVKVASYTKSPLARR
ncbi:MAG: hypothetical protein PHU23_15900 [Dehalococcoidales bacterium]|nr:hypothetical protein [Dehalococcoidales bacterium]